MAIVIHKAQKPPARQPDATRRPPSSGDADCRLAGRFQKVVVKRPLKIGGPLEIEDATSRYKILEMIGEGGSGRVLRAFDNILGMEVAVKVLAPNLVRNAEALEALKAEVRINLGLIHRHILRIYNLERSRRDYLIIMELLRGRTLAQHLAGAAAGMGCDFAVQLVEVAADALGHAHRHGVLHLDITPSNIFLTDDGLVKIIDFGIAKLMGAASASPEYIVGTPSYMSPEQLRGEELDSRADIYALGVIAAQLLTGHTVERPGAGWEEMAASPHPPVRGLPPAVAAVIERATAFDRAERFADIEMFAADLRKAADISPRN